MSSSVCTSCWRPFYERRGTGEILAVSHVAPPSEIVIPDLKEQGSLCRHERRRPTDRLNVGLMGRYTNPPVP